MNTILKIKELAIDILNENKALDIKVLNLHAKHTLVDYALIATGSSSRHLSMLKEKLQTKFKEINISDIKSEGEDSGNWIVISIPGLLIHLFRAEVREYYNIEAIWSNNDAN